MLVLQRDINEVILIGEDITIQVLDVIGGRKVKLGINAPADVRILREELRGRNICPNANAGTHYWIYQEQREVGQPIKKTCQNCGAEG